MPIVKLDNNKVKEYRGCFINGLMDSKFIVKETGLSDRSINSLLYNELYKDENYQISINKIKPKYKFPFTLPIRQKYTNAVRRVLSNYNIPIEERSICLKENFDLLTYDDQSAMFIDDENGNKYLFVVENNLNNNTGFLLPKNKYKIELRVEENRQYFSKFIYNKEDGVRINEIKKHKGYWITDDGVVISIGRGKILKEFINKKGYCQILLPKDNGEKQTYRVHRLVAESFIPNIENKPHVNHKDGNKQNNHYTNLEWCTNQENQDHSWKNGLIKVKYGEETNNSKLTNEQANEIREKYKTGKYTQKQLGILYNVSSTTIYYIINNVSYTEGLTSALVQKEVSPTKLENLVRR